MTLRDFLISHPTPGIARLSEWAERVTAQLATLTPEERRRVRQLATSTPLSIEQAIARVRAERGTS
jgi:hypothetical protein